MMGRTYRTVGGRIDPLPFILAMAAAALVAIAVMYP